LLEISLTRKDAGCMPEKETEMIDAKEFVEMEDRARNAWIDEHIMGFTVVPFSYDSSILVRLVKGRKFTIPPYHNRYDALRQLTDKMENLGYTWTVRYDFYTHDFSVRRFGNDKVYQAGWWLPLELQIPLAIGRALGKIE